MASIKLGDRLLMVGCSDTTLVAALAAKSGLTGRACMVCPSDEERTRAGAAVEQEGALVESVTAPATSLPFDAKSFDVAVIRRVLPGLDANERARCVEDVRRVLRPGGRCICIDDAPPSGFAALFRGQRGNPEYDSSGGAASLLTTAAFRTVRTLANRQGLVFVEGVKAAA